VLGFDYNTDKIIRSISYHCFSNTFLSQSQFSALSSTHCPRQVYTASTWASKDA